MKNNITSQTVSFDKGKKKLMWPGPNVAKHFTTVTKNVRYKLGFGPTRFFPETQSEAPERCFILGRLRPHLQSLDKAGKACKGRTLAYYESS
jgi:hypothetical protein